MKRKEVILDFTSLLDVTLIIIFFFVIFSHLDDERDDDLFNEKMTELENEIAAAQIREEEAEELIAQLEEEMEIVSEANPRTAYTTSAIFEYVNNRNIRGFLTMCEDYAPPLSA